MDEKMRGKKGQVALWVVIAVVLAASMLLFFFLEQRPFRVGEERFDPKQFLEKCAVSAASEVIEKILPQGGFLRPTNYKVYNDINVSYLCRSYGYYGPCINQHPLLINEISKEIKDYISPRIEACFESMKSEVEKRSNTFELGSSPSQINVSMAPGKVFIDIERSVKVTEKETSRMFDKFRAEMLSPLYDLTSVANNIANHERKYCYFEYVGYMGLDTSIDIKKFTMSDATKIYSIQDRKTGKIMNIAIRSCAIPAGI